MGTATWRPGGKDTMEPGSAPTGVDTSKAHPARMYDYYLGGNDSYPADREAAAAVLRGAPASRRRATCTKSPSASRPMCGSPTWITTVASRVVYTRAEPVRLRERPRFPGTTGRQRTKPPRDLTASDRVGDRCHHVREQFPGLAAGSNVRFARWGFLTLA